MNEPQAERLMFGSISTSISNITKASAIRSYAVVMLHCKDGVDNGIHERTWGRSPLSTNSVKALYKRTE